MTKTSITFLLDRSGSMKSILQSTLDGFNAYKATLKEIPEGMFTLITFDSLGFDKLFTHMPVSEIPDLTTQNFVPRDCTPLIDAAVKTIRAIERSVAEAPDTKVVLAILTDGHENASREHSWEQLIDLVTEKRNAGWQIVFLGAGIDAYQQAQRMGIDAVNTISYDSSDAAATQSVFMETGANTANFARGIKGDMGYSVEQKLSAGDVFQPSPAARPIAVAPQKPVAPAVKAFVLGDLEL